MIVQKPMHPSILIPALFFAAVSLALVVYVLRTFFGALAIHPRLYLDRSSCLRCQRALAELDRAIDDNRYLDAVKIIPAVASCRRAPRADALVRTLADLYVALLARIVLLSDSLGTLVPNLPALEVLLMERADLMRQYLEVDKNREKIAATSVRKGRTLPKWARAEYNKKRRQVWSQLEQNWAALAQQLKKVQEHLSAPPRSQQGSIYH
jgi:hypothetical protein